MPIATSYHSKITGSYKLDTIFKDITAASKAITNRIIGCLQSACFETVKAARLLPQPPADMRDTPHQPNYIDDTTLLRTSIGFVIYDHGLLVMSNFQGRGAEIGLQVANDAAAPYKNDICAIVVAGANYAAAVESRGYDVITGSTRQLMDLFQSKLKIVFSK